MTGSLIPPRYSIARRLFMYIFLAGFFMTLLCTGLILYIQYCHEINNIEKSLSNVKTGYVPSVSSTLWISDYELLEQQLKAIVNLHDIVYVSVNFPDGSIMSAGAIPSGKTLTGIFPLVSNFRNKEIPLGTLTVTASLNNVYTRLISTAWIVTGGSALIIFVMCGIFLLAFQTFVGRHLSYLSLQVSEFDPYIHDKTFELKDRFHNSDELSKLLNAFNGMCKNLNNVFTELEEANKHLREEIKEREQIQSSLRESEERFRALFEQASAGVAQIETKTGKFLKINKTYCDIVGYTQEEMSNITFQQLTDRDDSDLGNINLLAEGKIREFTAEKRFYHKSGSSVWVHLTISPLRTDREEGCMSVIQDITGRKAMEEQKNKLEHQLRQSQKMEAVGTLAGRIAHDFNNILGAIIGFTELSLFDVPPDSPVSDYLNRILLSGNRARDLVKQILVFSRKEQPECKPVEIGSAIRESLKLLRPLLPSTVEIRENIPIQSISIMADITRIHQILMNLLTNASHAMREKGGVIQIELTAMDISVPYPAELKPGPFVMLNVSDTGPGMEKHVMERIFEPYFTTKKHGEGTGMGLSVVYGIVKNYGGHINVYSEPGKGTSFHIYLPVIDRTIVSEKSEQVTGGHEKILFVDDEKELVNVYRIMLKNLGYDVTAIYDSEEALNLFRHEPDKFDLLITDYTMPKLTGAELAFKIFEIKPDFPVILCSGFSEALNREQAIEAGIKEFLMKPLNKKIVARAIRKVLDKL
ncbi:MAG: ATP-binding protein [Candidatus Eremiobacterota bacterium]